MAEIKPIPKESLWDGENITDELWSFLEDHIYWNCNYIAWIDDVDKVLDDDYDDDFKERNEDLFDMTTEDLLEYRNRMVDSLFNEAYEDYLEGFKKSEDE